MVLVILGGMKDICEEGEDSSKLMISLKVSRHFDGDGEELKSSDVASSRSWR